MATRAIPPIRQMPLTIGGKLMPCCSVCLISSGPNCASFFSWFQCSPPQANPTMPTMMRTMPIIPAGFTRQRLQRSTAADQLQNEHHEGDHQQNVNVSTEHVEPDKSEQPQNQQDYKYCPKHNVLSVEFVDLSSFGQAHSRVPKVGRRAPRFIYRLFRARRAGANYFLPTARGPSCNRIRS